MVGKNFPHFPKAAITEISGLDGSGKTEAVLRFLAENPSLKVAWVEQEFTVYPCAFPQNGVSLERVFFIDIAARVSKEKAALWVVHQVLSSQVFGAVVLNIPVREAVPLRKLQLAAEKNGAIVILLSERPTAGATWPIHLQLQASRDPETGDVRLSVLRSRGQKTILEGQGCRPQTA